MQTSIPLKCQPANGTLALRPSRHALIVGAESASTRLSADTLRRMRFEVSRANSGVAGVVAARERVPTLILMDVQLPDASASETIGWIRSNEALTAVPILVLGNFEGLAPKCTRSIAKPLSAAALEQAVRDLCG